MKAPMEKTIIPWKRFWCRSGDKIHVGDHQQGFLTDPEGELYARLLNPHLVTFDKLLNEKCLILWGDPGIGKSTVLQQGKSALESSLGTNDKLIWLDFRDVPNEQVFARRTFESITWKGWQSSTGKLVLVVDGVDEGLVKIPGFIGYLVSELRNMPVERLQVILACRSAEWPISEGQQLIGLWGIVEKPPIFELCPLRHRDAVQAAEMSGVDGHNFIAAVYQKKVVGLASLPTTLFFLLDEFCTSGIFSGTHRELYERGCRRLARENDLRRIELLRALRNSSRISTQDEIYEAGCRLATLLLLCGKSAIHIGLVADATAESDLHLSEAVDDSGVDVPHLTEDVFYDAVCSALFTSRGQHRFGFTHQTFAECLAAQFLSGLPLVQIRKLLCIRDTGDEHVVPQLAETAAWVAGIRDDFFDYLCRVEPEALIRSDVSKVQDRRKEVLVAAILEKAKRADLFDERNFTRFFSSLKHPKIASQLRPYLCNKSLNVVVRRMAFSIVAECEITELCDELLRMVRDTSEDQIFRDLSAQTLGKLIPADRLAELMPLARGEIIPDPQDTIRGSAIGRLVPEFWSVSQAVPYLQTPQSNHFFGSYRSLLKYHLPRFLTVDDLPVLLERFVQETHCFDRTNVFEELAEAAFVKALENLSKPNIRRLAVQVWMTKATNFHPLPRGNDAAVGELFQKRENLRREFVAAIIDDPQIAINDLNHLRGSASLILESDLEWALNQITQSIPERLAAWSSVVLFLCRPETACKCWDLLLQRIDEIPELASRFSWLRAYDLNEPDAQKAKAEWLTHKQQEMRLNENREPGPNIEEFLENDFAEIKAGKSARWIDVCAHLSLEKDQLYFSYPLDHDLTAYPGWRNADAKRQNLIRAAAKNFLLIHSDGYAEIGNRSNFSDPGYIAIWLLRDQIRNDSELKSAVATKWIDALTGHFNGGSENYQETAAIAYELNPDATLRGFIRELKNDDEQHGQILALSGFRKCWDINFTNAALNLIRNGNLRAGSIESIFQFIGPIAPAEAAACAQLLLDSASLANPAYEERTVNTLTACIGGMPAATWHFVWPIIEANSVLAEKVLTRVANRINYSREVCLPALSEKQLADLYLKVHHFFPPETDPDFHGGFVSPRQGLVHFRGDIIGSLEARGTEEACCELLRLANALPRESLWLRWRYYNARMSKWRRSWIPPQPAIVLLLAVCGETRLVVDADDLTEVLLESLERFQVRLTRNELPRSEVLWNWEGNDTRRQNFRPRDEAFLSDEIARWLREDLVERGVVIDREVQPRRGQHTDIHVTAVSQARITSIQNITVVIEIKGCWNSEVRTAIDGQLVGKYLRLNGLTHGIYLVGWFVCDKWNNLQNKLISHTFADAQEEVVLLAAAYDGKANPERVAAIVLDCRYPDSTIS